MAPEQIEGRDADARTDLFAFGCVVYEMLTGRKAFEGTTPASVIGAIMHVEPPPLSTILPIAPIGLDRIVTKCLLKDADDRWQSARDLGDELQMDRRTQHRRCESLNHGNAVRALCRLASCSAVDAGRSPLAQLPDSRCGRHGGGRQRPPRCA